MCVCVCMLEGRRVHHICAVPEEAEEGIGFPGTGVTDSLAPPRGCCDPNLDLWCEQQVWLPH